MFGSNKKYLTISINEGIIKVAQGTSSGSLEKIARASFDVEAGVEDAAKALKTLLAPFNRKLPVICLIPAGAATAKNIEVPSVDPEEIKSIINLQASRHTPYSREEVLISYINLGLNASNNTRLLLVIVHRDGVKERISILEKAGLDADKILFVPEAQARFYAKAMNLKKESPLVGVVDFSLNATSYIVISRGSLLFVRNIPVGIKGILEGTDATAKLQDELMKSMDAFTQECGSEPPKSYTVTTKHEAVSNILASLKDALGLEFQVNAFSNFVKGSEDVRRKIQKDFADDSFLDVIAPALSAVKCEINLMPEEMILKKTVELQRKEATLSGAAAIIIMAIVGIMIILNIRFKETYLTKNLREQFAPQKAQVEVLQQKMNKAKLVRGYMKNRMASLDIIDDVYAITPHTTYLNNITVDDDGVVTIDGISSSTDGTDSTALVYIYLKSLQDSTKFKEAKLKSTAPKKDNGKDVAAFEIQFKMANFKEPA